MLTHTLSEAELLPTNGIRYQELRLLGDGEPSTLGFGWAVVEPHGRTAGHAHPEPEYYIVIQGTGIMRVADETEPVVAGQAVFIPSGLHHRITNTGDGQLVYLAVYWHPALEHLKRLPHQAP